MSEPTLLPQHAALIAASVIAQEVAEARGYRSVTTKAELARLGFSAAQQITPTLLLPVWNVLGENGLYQHRPDEPRVNRRGKPVKYEFPSGATMQLDVPPGARSRLGDPKHPLFITEGIRKADAAVSQGLCCVAVIGVWNWRGTNDEGGKTLLADFEMVAFNGRTVYLVYDSDVMTKREVYAALVRLSEVVKRRGAHVRFIYLPAGEGGSKTGLDDYLAAPHGVDDLLAISSTELRTPPEDGRAPDAPYEATPHGLVWNKPTKDGTIPTTLTNFIARVTAEILRDDGAETSRVYEMEAAIAGRAPSRFTIPAQQFAGMNWALEWLGVGAVLTPGLGARDHARAAVQLLSTDVRSETVYAHTGWRTIEGRPVYLSAGASIDATGAVEGVTVDLSPKFVAFALPAPPADAETLRDAVRASLAVLDVATLRQTAPLLGATYLAPLCELLGSERPDFTTFLVGDSLTGKSELAALAQAHYGPFHRKNLPLNFLATPNAVERGLFEPKDMLCVVDDYYPATDPREAGAMAQVAARLLRGAGNVAGRSRQRADLTLRPDFPPRAVPLATGERKPAGFSANARAFYVALARGDVKRARLDALRSRCSLFPVALAGYVREIAKAFDALRETLPARFRELRDRAAGADLAREPGQIAHLFLGVEMLTSYAETCGAITPADGDRLRTDAWEALRAEAAESAADRAQQTVPHLFVSLLGDGLASRRAYLESRTNDVPDDAAVWGWELHTVTDRDGNEDHRWRHAPGATLLGWVEDDWLLLLPDATYQFVAAAARAAGQIFPVEKTTLLKRLDEAGLIATTIEGEHTRREIKVRLGDTTRRVVKLRRDALTVPEPEPPTPTRDREQREQREHSAGADSDAGENVFPETAVFPENREQDREPGTENQGTLNLDDRPVPAVPGVPSPGAPGEGDGVTAGGALDDEPSDGVVALAAALGYLEVGVFKEPTGPGEAAWRAWAETATPGQRQTMTGVLHAMLDARRGAA